MKKRTDGEDKRAIVLWTAVTSIVDIMIELALR
jgi:hypothetical protein